jgi:hypothetical protein
MPLNAQHAMYKTMGHLNMTKTFSVTYQFTLPDAHEETFALTFDAQSIQLVNDCDSNLPFWTDLEYHQCPHCPLQLKDQHHCPVALNLTAAIYRLDRVMSFEQVMVKVTTAQRQVEQTTSAQEGISSLMGLLIAGSSCPITHYFKPMARFHLPFANRDETMWRAAATFLLSRYFSKHGLQTSDMNLDGLVKIYDDIATLNDYVVERLRAATSKDSAVNALVHLDVYARFLTPPLAETLNHIRPIFLPFLNRLADA